jgi:hypothetical protein
MLPSVINQCDCQEAKREIEEILDQSLLYNLICGVSFGDEPHQDLFRPYFLNIISISCSDFIKQDPLHSWRQYAQPCIVFVQNG